MAMGKRRREQQAAWVATTDLPKSPGHPFYEKLNRLLAEAGFDAWVENLCAPYYAEALGRPSIPPGVYFRMIFVGYFEGIGSQRGIAWRCSDSRALQAFLGIPLMEPTPEHSSLTRVHQRLPLEVHEEVFRFLLQIAVAKKLVQGKTVAVDSTTLEANAAMKTIVRKDSGEDWPEYLQRLASAAGIDHPTAAELRRFDRQRQDKKVSNEEWESPTDPDSRITKMKDGTTHLAYKAEHVVDVATDFVLGVTVHGGTAADTTTLVDSVVEAQINLDAAHGVRRENEADADVESPQAIRDVVADKGYHDDGTLEQCTALGLRTYIPEPQRRHQRRWTDKPSSYRAAVYANRRRVQGARSKRLQRRRSELTERSFAHVCETGGGRRCCLRGLLKVTKRYLLQVAARNLGLILRKLFGIGTARSLQGSGALAWLVYLVIGWCRASWSILRNAMNVLRHGCVTRRFATARERMTA
jgi:transposase